MKHNQMLARLVDIPIECPDNRFFAQESKDLCNFHWVVLEKFLNIYQKDNKRTFVKNYLRTSYLEEDTNYFLFYGI